MAARFFGLFAFALAVTLTAQVEAQSHHNRGILARGSQLVFGKSYHSHHHARHHHPHLHAWKNRWFHNQELPPLRPDDGWGRYPKYYGGFHSSHFDRVGVPHGDIGFRGPSIYWTPW